MRFAHPDKKQYLCTMKLIEYYMPVESVSGNMSGRQNIEYDGGRAYGIAPGNKVSSETYQPRFIARVMGRGTRRQICGYQVRTKTSVNMTAGARHSMALMGGAGAIYASLMGMKTSAIYRACVDACPRGSTLRAFIIPLLRAGLQNKSAQLTITTDVSIVNPWVSTATPNVPVSNAVLDKFNSELSNS